MKLLSLLTLAFITIAGLPNTVKAMDDHKMATPTVETSVIKAVAFHSDTCGSCKILGPKMKEALGVINKDRLDVVKFNFTDKDTIAKTRELAASKDVEAILQKFGAKTGFVALVNGKGEVVDKLNARDSVSEIAVKLAKAIAEAS